MQKQEFLKDIKEKIIDSLAWPEFLIDIKDGSVLNMNSANFVVSLLIIQFEVQGIF